MCCGAGCGAGCGSGCGTAAAGAAEATDAAGRRVSMGLGGETG